MGIADRVMGVFGVFVEANTSLPSARLDHHKTLQLREVMAAEFGVNLSANFERAFTPGVIGQACGPLPGKHPSRQPAEAASPGAAFIAATASTFVSEGASNGHPLVLVMSRKRGATLPASALFPGIFPAPPASPIPSLRG